FHQSGQELSRSRRRTHYLQHDKPCLPAQDNSKVYLPGPARQAPVAVCSRRTAVLCLHSHQRAAKGEVTMIECPRCYTKVPMDGDRPRPWCPQCGGELKAAAASQEPARVAQGGPSKGPLDSGTVRRMVDEVVGPDPSK